jgi:nucleoside-diphosphate-sugar epimerase
MTRDVILVTGGAGYLGTVLVPMLLAKNYRVRILEQFYFGHEPLGAALNDPRLEIVEEDILHQENITDLYDDVFAVIHLASISNDPSCDLDPNLTIRTNFLATMALARRAKIEGVSRFIFASSCSVYGAKTDAILDEQSETGPVTLYALTKLEAEREIARLADDKFVVCLPRLATLFGLSPRMRFDLAVNVMVKRCLTGEGLLVNGTGAQYRPFLHVRDAAEVFMRLLTADPKAVNAQVVNVGSNVNNYTIRALAEKIAAAFPGMPVKQVSENADVRSYCVNFDKLGQMLGYEPRRTIDDAIKEISAAFIAGKLKNMNDFLYYNLFVLKDKLTASLAPPNMATPSLAGGRRWSSVMTGSNASLASIKVQALATTTKRPKVVAVILAYNCAHMLERAYQKIPKDAVDDIIVSDDCSKDDTFAVAQKIGVKVYRTPTNLGYGGNLKSALKIAFDTGADYVVEVHGDGAQFNPISIKYAQPYMEQGYDLVLGSRFQKPLRALQNGMPLIRFVSNRFLSFFDRLVLRLPLTEFHTGFRIYSRKLFETLPLKGTSDDHLFSFQVIAQSAYYNLKVAEVEVEADYISEHTSHKLTGAAVYAIQTFGILLNFMLAKLQLRYTPLFLVPERGGVNEQAKALGD